MPRTTAARAAALALALAATAAAWIAGAANGPSRGDPAAGKALFVKNCILCHKANGTGGMKITGNPSPDWTDAKTWADAKRSTDDYFRDCITNGKVKSGMVAWGKSGQIKPAEIENLIAYIHTFAPKKK
ncbi:MAG: cytochrome c [Candidatus Eisenbacteria bacterium]|uniref:Cytochrome c n=1 Tax=Eiseniibacteriota bacterium TaxID=2212470 RepID=A0A9D6L756_UNCEI|nr:cytochrome c [Candidatus Eisenbacteria bacterium]MBI3539866.1 cytochrome c [Candidatus Eisenbacteria bacterium]